MDVITAIIKTVDNAVTKTLIELQTTGDKLGYGVVNRGSTEPLGIGSEPVIVRVKRRETIGNRAMDLLL